ncbi:Holliday junction resolvase RuvX [Halioxenophilus sp. WMMB6]|uniref:Holliday junction resolvase RuvX n=1 Tax=Halioxenophilus sp. WMMB6 TaxID=3073815 RepID=UPI00295EDBAE|nr:Holliday junction resolvase RuvX [Halioxenophilus sp. WMMB6]
MTGTLLCFDFGSKNIGVAVGQRSLRSASELKSIPARDGVPNWEQVGALLREWQPELLLVGLPLNMDGSESEIAGRAKKFGNRLHGRFGLPVTLVDERLSTREAKLEARDRGHRGDYGKNPIDSIAARLILESWYERDEASQIPNGEPG